MSEQNVYKELYEVNQLAAQQQASLQNIYQALFPLVSPEGVQLTLQEVIDLTVHALSKEDPDVGKSAILSQDEQVASEAHSAAKE